MPVMRRRSRITLTAFTVVSLLVLSFGMVAFLRSLGHSDTLCRNVIWVEGGWSHRRCWRIETESLVVLFERVRADQPLRPNFYADALDNLLRPGPYDKPGLGFEVRGRTDWNPPSDERHTPQFLGFDHWSYVTNLPDYAISSGFAVPDWLFIAVGSFLPLLRAYHWLGQSKERYRAKRGQCIKCGYDLRATPTRCPERGAVPNSFTLRQRA
jgi:hypothetical protein